MNFKSKFSIYGLGGLCGALLVSAVGLLLLRWDSTLSQFLENKSYDWSFTLTRFASPDVTHSDVEIVYLDEKSFKDLNQPQNVPWDRTLHAKLLDKLKQDGAKAVVMDIVFSDPGPNSEADERFAEAIRANGRVVLGVDYNRPAEEANNHIVIAGKRKGQIIEKKPLHEVLTFPYTPFERAMAAGGLVQLNPDDDFTVRRHLHNLDDQDLAPVDPAERSQAPPSLSWATARMLGLKSVRGSTADSADRWIYYYGHPVETLTGIGFSDALVAMPAHFQDKVVFIGALPKTGLWTEKRDEMRSPYGSSVRKIPMVEIHATEFLNLERGDWLSRPSLPNETMILVLAALLFGIGLLNFRPWQATGVAVAGALAVILLVQSLFAVCHVWFVWLIIVGAQIPCALLYAIIFRALDWYAQRKKLEAEQRLADARIREQAALLDKAGDAIIVHDINWHAQFWNKSAEILYGWSFEELKPLNLKSDVFKTDEAKLLEALQLALAKGEWSGELKQTTKAGKLLIVQSRWTLVRDDQGRPKSVLVINTDVTEQKKLEAQFLRTQRMESIGTLAGGIAHDLNNVLSPILMGVEMMKMKVSDPFTEKMLTTMGSSAKRGSDMVKQVLTFARGHEGEKTVLQISHLIREMQKIVKETFPKSIDFSTALEGNLWPILGDATQIHQIILNLCVNARDAMPDGGKITVHAKNAPFTEEAAKKSPGARPVHYVLLSVSDTGTGIPPEIMDKIFEPFFTTKEIGKGTGLGLSTVICIIKSHGGFLDLQTQVGKGASFNVYLPAAEAAVAPVSAPVPEEQLKGSGETVMIVDDEPAVLELAKHVLIHYGFNVVTAIHGADALALYPQFRDKIRVVIMDMMMPVMDGPLAIRALRKENSRLPIIAISGLIAGDKIHERLGGEDVLFLSKPFAIEKLVLTVREALAAKVIPEPGVKDVPDQSQVSLTAASKPSSEPSLAR